MSDGLANTKDAIKNVIDPYVQSGTAKSGQVFKQKIEQQNFILSI
jgi:hypothetical protein